MGFSYIFCVYNVVIFGDVFIVVVSMLFDIYIYCLGFWDVVNNLLGIV